MPPEGKSCSAAAAALRTTRKERVVKMESTDFNWCERRRKVERKRDVQERVRGGKRASRPVTFPNCRAVTIMPSPFSCTRVPTLYTQVKYRPTGAIRLNYIHPFVTCVPRCSILYIYIHRVYRSRRVTFYVSRWYFLPGIFLLRWTTATLIRPAADSQYHFISMRARSTIF